METPLDVQSSDTLTKDCPIECSRKLIYICPEILYPIIEEVVSTCVDLAITKPREASSAGLPREDNGEGLQNAGPDVGGSTADPQHATNELPDNTIISLLSVSYSFRDITLKILSGAFSIERTADGALSQNPWNLLNISRRLYHLAQSNTLTPQHVADAGEVVSKSLLLTLYLYLSVCQGFSRRLFLDVECLPPGTPYDFKALVGYTAATSVISKRHLFRRVLERLRYFMSSFNVVMQLCVCSRDLQHLQVQFSDPSRDADERAEIARPIEQRLEDLKNCQDRFSFVVWTTSSSPSPSTLLTQDVIGISDIRDTLTTLIIIETLPVHIIQSAKGLLDTWSRLPAVRPYQYLW